MTIRQLRQALRQLAQEYFRDREVFFADEKRGGPGAPFVELRLRSVAMSTHPCVRIERGTVVKSHPGTALLEMNLYGPVEPGEDPGAIDPEDTAMEELAGFCHYLEYPSTENFLFQNDISLVLEGDPPPPPCACGPEEEPPQPTGVFTGKVVDLTPRSSDGSPPEDDEAPVYRTTAVFAVSFTQTFKDPYARNDGQTQDGQAIDKTGYFTEAAVQFVPDTETP